MKLKIFILSFLSLVTSVCTYLVLINYNLVYFYFKEYSIFAFIVFPLITAAIVVFTGALIFKNNKMIYLVPATIGIVGCLLAFVLSNDGSNAKIESDFLKNEDCFNQALVLVEDVAPSDEIIEIDVPELKWVLPESKAMIVSVGNGKKAYFFIASDLSDRYEGYVYAPSGTPIEWDDYGYFYPEEGSLDLNGAWFYMSLLK